MEVLYEESVIAYLNLPSIPKKEWNGKSSFDKGVAVVELYGSREAYAVASYDENKDSEPRIIKAFAQEPFSGIKKIFVVPNYMVTEEDVEKMDLDEESKKKATSVLKEAKEIENEGTGNEEDELAKLPEWIFPHITNREEAEAFVRSYRQRNKIKGKVPQSDDNLKAYLYVIYKNTQGKNNNKGKKK